MRAVIDADVIVYQACIAATVTAEVELGGDLVLHDHMSVAHGEDVFDAMVQSVKDQVETEDVMLVLSADTNFRKDIYERYKHNRKGIRPIGWSSMRQHAQDAYGAFYVSPLEGDDLVGIHGGQPGSVIVSIDKDLKTIPGMHLDNETGEVYEIDEQAADRWWMTQTLTGDSVDGYPGCPGIGKVRAERMLEECEPVLADMWPVVVAAYEKAGLTEDDAIVQARLARILRPDDYDGGTIKLWQPTW